MSLQGKIKRYTLIIDLLNRDHYPSLQEIKVYIYDFGFEISERTIQRDIEQLRIEFGIEILYSHKHNGYYLNKTDKSNIETFIELLQIANNAEIITESILESKENLSFISFDRVSGLEIRGIENLNPLLNAIKENQKAIFKHLNYSTGKTNDYSVIPHLLKQYKYRWYLLATVEPELKIKTFGLDRVQDLKITVDRVDKKNVDYSDYFNNIIGVTNPEGTPEEIILQFDLIQGKYIISAPIHTSQVVIKESDQGIQISLFIFPNIEFKQQILMYGETVEVIKPNWLKREIVEIYAKSIKKYKYF